MERKKPRATNRFYPGLSLGYLALKDLEIDLTVTFDRVEKGAPTYGATELSAAQQNLALKADAAVDNDSKVGLFAGIRGPR